jgi:hypothetical protein
VYDEIGNNLVTKQSINGSEVPAGKMITKGTRIDLVVIKNQSENSADSDSLVLDEDFPEEEGLTDQQSERKKRKKAH